MTFGSAELKSFLNSICTDAPESRTNYLLSCLIDDGAGRHLTSEGEKNVALFRSRCPLSLCAFWPSPMLLCVPIALLPRNLVVFDLQNLEQRNCAHEDEWVEEHPVMVFSTEFLRTVKHLAQSEPASLVSSELVPFRRIDLTFGVSPL